MPCHSEIISGDSGTGYDDGLTSVLRCQIIIDIAEKQYVPVLTLLGEQTLLTPGDYTCMMILRKGGGIAVDY